MKKLLILILMVVAIYSNATTYYVSTTGNNGNNGSAGSPWLTLTYACANTVSGDAIHINAGTHALTSRVEVPIGVSIEGDGVTSILTSNIATQYYCALLLESETEGTNGNQHISNIKMDGLNTGWGAISIQGRSNVHIYNCTFIDFAYSGVTFNGAIGYQETPPSVYATGNRFYNNIVTNCSEYELEFAYGNGGLLAGGQDGMLIYGNTMSQVGRAAGHNGYVIKYYCNGFNKGMKIYNNTITKAPFSNLAGDFDFAIEMWNHRGGVEIYNNTIVGGIDVGGESNTKGAYTFSCKIYGNTIGQTTLQPYEESGMYIERNAFDVIVDSNIFKNVSCAVNFFPAPTDSVGRITISRNLIYNVGTSAGGFYGYAIRWGTTTGGDGTNVYDIYILNNTIIGGVTNDMAGIMLPDVGTANRIYIRNNIIQDFDYAPIYSNTSGTINNLYIQNNMYYLNANSNAILIVGNTPTNYTNSNNQIANPLFVSSSNYTLQVSSPAINAGINVGFPYAGTAPDMGAYEYGTIIPDPPDPPSVSGVSAKNGSKRVINGRNTVKH